MKKNLFFAALVLFAAGVVVSGCKDGAKKTTVEVTERYDLGAMADEVVGLVREITNKVDPRFSPKASCEAGLIYRDEFVVQQDSYEKMLTIPQKAYGTGAILFDIFYATQNERPDEMGRLAAYGRALVLDLGFADELSDQKEHKYLKAAEELMANKDSLEVKFRQYVDRVHSVVGTSEEVDVYAYMLFGLNVELLYIHSAVAAMVEDNEKLLELLTIDKPKVVHVYNIMKMMKDDPNVAPLYKDFTDVMQVYEDEITKENIVALFSASKKARANLVK